MKSKVKFVVFAATAFLGVPVFAQVPKPRVNALQTGQVVVGPARFTVVSPLCVRLEYAPNNGFVDAPTLFAINRGARDAKAKIQRTAKGVTIETAAMRLVYEANGQPFNAQNLKVTFRNGSRAGSWAPGQDNSGNMGGAASTLDFINRPIDLPDGLVSRDGWSLIDDSGRAIRANGWIAARPGGGPPSADIAEKNRDLDWYLFAYGQNYQGVLQTLGTISGAAAMPRREVLGSWNSRFTRLTSEDYRQLVREYEEHDFPLDIVVMDMDWHTQNATEGLMWSNNLGWTGYTWDKKLIPDPEGLLKEFKAKGIHVTLNDHPHDGIRQHEEVYPQFMKSLGLAADGTNLPFNVGNKKYSDAFFAASHEPLEKQGVDFWWLDWQQDSLVPWVPGVPGLRHLPWLNELYFQRSEANGLRGQGYSRWGGWGDQRNPMQFSGDTASNWNILAFEVPFSAASGNSGCFFWAHDTGGFFGGNRNAEQYTRWTQFSGLSAALRVHSAGEDRRPWLWGKQAEEAMRVTYRLRSEIFPYIYTSVRQSYDEMKPLLRPMYLNHPDQEAAYQASGQYLYGDNVLVAPIVSPGVGPGFVAQQSLWFPQGSWFNYFTGESFQGGTQALVTADLNEVPLYVRGGVPLPMQPYTQRMTSAPLKTLRLVCYPGENGKVGTSSLYEDDGRSSAYKNKGFSRTPLSYRRSGGAVEVSVGAPVGQFAGQLSQRAYSIELRGTTPATKVSLRTGGKVQTLSSQYDATTQTNRIEIPAQSLRQPISLTVTCDPADAGAMQRRAMTRRVRGIMGDSAATTDARDALAAGTASPEQKQMLLATMGIGLIKQMEGPDFGKNPGRLLFFAPQGVLDGGTLKISRRSGGEAQQKLNGSVLPLGQATAPRDSPILDFQIDGQALRLPSVSNPLLGADNVALSATVTASSTENGYDARSVNDGEADGYPNNALAEWSSNGQKEGTTMRLNWATPQMVNRIVLFDRPNDTDDVTSGVLTFSDGTTLEVGALSGKGTEVRFPAKTISWVSFRVNSVKPGTVNAGLSEFAVFRAP
jgi:alpha-glucosidase (family GH31 glycosyl hydrolase)